MTETNLSKLLLVVNDIVEKENQGKNTEMTREVHFNNNATAVPNIITPRSDDLHNGGGQPVNHELSQQLMTIRHRLPLEPPPNRERATPTRPTIQHSENQRRKTLLNTEEKTTQTDKSVYLSLPEMNLISFIRSRDLSPSRVIQTLNEAHAKASSEGQYPKKNESPDNVIVIDEKPVPTITDLVFSYSKTNKNLLDAVFNFSKNKPTEKDEKVKVKELEPEKTQETLDDKRSFVKSEILKTLHELMKDGTIKVGKKPNKKKSDDSDAVMGPTEQKRHKPPVQNKPMDNALYPTHNWRPDLSQPVPLMTVNYVHSFHPAQDMFQDGTQVNRMLMEDNRQYQRQQYKNIPPQPQMYAKGTPPVMPVNALATANTYHIDMRTQNAQHYDQMQYRQQEYHRAQGYRPHCNNMNNGEHYPNTQWSYPQNKN